MSTLNLDGLDYTLVFVDPTIGTAGDGTTPATALLTLPSVLANETCYIIRRTSTASYVDLIEQVNASLINCIIMGMPLSTQVYYDLLPAEAKIWTDSYDYANVRCNIATASNSTTKASLYTNNLVNLYCINCYFFRDGNGGTATSYLNPIFLTNRIDFTTNYTFDYCKFGYYGYDFDNASYRASNSTIPTDTTKYPQRKCTNYLYANCLNSLTVTNSIINSVLNSYTSIDPYAYNNPAFTSAKLYNAKFNNNNMHYIDLYNGTNTSYNYSHILYVNDNSSPTNRLALDFNNNNVYPILYATLGWGSRPAVRISVGVSRLTMLDNNVVFLKMLGANPTQIGSTSAIFNFSYLQNFNISNLSVNGRTSEGKVPEAMILYVDNGNQLANGVPNIGINNIDIKLSEDMGDVQALSSNTSKYAIYINTFNSVSMYTTNTSTIANTASNNGNVGSAFMLSNITIEAPLSYALYANKVALKGLSIKGYVTLNQYCTADFTYLYNYYGSRYGLNLGSCNYVRIREYEVNKNNVNSLYLGSEQVYIDPLYIPSGNTVYVDTCNCSMFNSAKLGAFYDMNRDCILSSPNYITTGQYYSRNQSSEIISSNVMRQGSVANASLKFSNLVFSSLYDMLALGKDCYKGIQITPTETGSKLFTAYLAYENIEIPYNIRNGLSFEIRVPSVDLDENITYKVHDSKSGIFTVDTTSTWINSSTTLNLAKIQIPIEVTTLLHPIETKIYFGLYTNLGSIYVDPDFQLL